MVKLIIKSISIIATTYLISATPVFAYDQEDFVIVKDNSVVANQDNNTSNNVFGKIAIVAKNLIGTKYKFGGTSPATGFDCSGFVKYVFKEGADIKLPRGSRDMRTLGKAVDLKSLKPGDLIFFRLNSSHVGIYVGDNRFVHAPRTGRSVTIDSILDASFANKVVAARRLVELD